MISVLKYVGQVIILAIAAVLVGYFSASPAYRNLPQGMAMIKLSFAHAGKRVVPCRKRTAKELQELAPNMRRKTVCQRERLPLLVDFEIDGETVHHAILQPTGLSRDLASRIYEKFAIAGGHHSLTLRLRDTNRGEGYDYEQEFDVDLRPSQNLAIDFRADLGGFVIR